MKQKELEQEVLAKLQNKIAIYNYTKENDNISKNKLIKMVATFIISVGITMGVVYAGSIIYEKVWKEPEKVEGFYHQDGTTTPISEEEIVEAISKEEAINKANELLKEFGYEDEEIQTSELQNNPSDNRLTWQLETNNKFIITIDAKNPNSFGIITDALHKNIKSKNVTEAEVQKLAESFCEKYGYNLNEYNNLKITNNGTENPSIWYIVFSKKYNQIANPYQKISIGIIPDTNDLYYFIVDDNEFENNEVIITEEQAKQIVLEAEKKIDTGHEISETHINLDIARMNGYAYLRAKDYKQYYEQTHTPNYPSEKRMYYRTADLVRKAWMVTVEYKGSLEELGFDKYYTYIVDCTTGEIIGGNELYYTSYII